MPCRKCHFTPCRCDDLAAGYMGKGNTPACWPMKSEALAVHPDQIEAAMARNKAHGIRGVTYDPVDGRAILADRGARRDLMRLEGMHDRSGGYGDDHGSDSPMPPIQGSDIADLEVPIRFGVSPWQTK